jgi:hypothetical protein
MARAGLLLAACCHVHRSHNAFAGTAAGHWCGLQASLECIDPILE